MYLYNPTAPAIAGLRKPERFLFVGAQPVCHRQAPLCPYPNFHLPISISLLSSSRSNLRPFAQSWEIPFPSLPIPCNVSPASTPSSRHLILCARVTRLPAASPLGTSHAPFLPAGYLAGCLTPHGTPDFLEGSSNAQQVARAIAHHPEWRFSPGFFDPVINPWFVVSVCRGALPRPAAFLPGDSRSRPVLLLYKLPLPSYNAPWNSLASLPCAPRSLQALSFHIVCRPCAPTPSL